MDNKIGKLRCNRAILCAAVAFAVSAGASDTKELSLNIPGQNAGTALMELAKRADVQIMIANDLGMSIQLPPISGTYTLAAALDQMLNGTGLNYEFRSDESVVIKKIVADEADRERARDESKPHVMEEMVVTATKRETSLQDTAMSISVLGSDAIDKRGLTQMGDYLSTLPGVTMHDTNAGQNAIVMRGIASDPQVEREAVGVYFGETPMAGVGSNGAGSADLKMVDINRVEVLRGPQGTLYGAGSMGGTVRIIPNDPDLTQVEGSMAAQYSRTGKLGGGNNVVQAVLNVPIIANTLAVRGVAYRYENSGYIENVAGSIDLDNFAHELLTQQNATYGMVRRSADDIGGDETVGFRLAAKWQPIEPLVVNLTHAWQELEQHGRRDVDTILPGDYQQVRLSAWEERRTTWGYGTRDEDTAATTGLTNLVVDYDLGWAGLHSSSSWLNSESVLGRDFSYLLPFPWYALVDNDDEVFAQEFRFASQFDGPLQVLAGVYYEDKDRKNSVSQGYEGDPANEETAIANYFYPPLPSDAPAGFVWDDMSYDSIWKRREKQKAFFGELSYAFTDQLVATVGVRRYEYEQRYTTHDRGFFSSTISSFSVASDLLNEYKGQNYKANLTWTPNDDTLIYAQWAEGFRLGQPLGRIVGCEEDGYYVLPNGAKIPIRDGTDPDSLDSYELGYKATFADNRVTLNTAVYHIDWQGLPVLIRPACNLGSTYINAGKSTSEGIELESQILLTDNLRLNLSASYNESKLAEDAENLGKKGDRLPGSADVNFTAGVEYGFNVSGYNAFARLDYSYIGEFYSYIDETEEASGGYGQIHLKSGVELGGVDVDLFVRNLTNADGFIWVESFSSGNVPGSRGYRLRPRTIGMNVSYRF